MDLNNFKKNTRAIQKTPGISQQKKAALLRTQMHVLEVLFRDKTSALTEQEMRVACALYHHMAIGQQTLLNAVPGECR